jgi:diguanylate cyclase (GGDEF)-like protein/PAS domain S-box-containing protein
MRDTHDETRASADATSQNSGRLAGRVARAAAAVGRLRDRAELEYQSLFDNAVCGIYLDFLDGTPIRANRALYTFNGYNSEEEHLLAVKTHGGSWYVDPERAHHFHHLLSTQGFVRDLVSEVYRHRTRERAWITENAWYVRDTDGKPLYIEGTIQDATERVLATAEIERQANTDALTGAASRFCFMNALSESVALHRDATALLTVDLDRFKAVNDLFGHDAGDMVLRTAVQRLRAATAGHKTTIGRLGGDEFAVLLHHLNHPDDVAIVAGAIVQAMSHPVAIEGHDIVVGASVGAAICPLHARGVKDLLTSADLALYDVKKRGRNGFCVFTPNMRAHRERRKMLEAELNTAIQDDTLELYYQPIVNTYTQAVTGYEALMRWNHPTRGLLQPSAFIPMAEEAGLMTALGNWAIQRACRQASSFPDDCRIAVNVSPSQFRSASIVEAVRSSLADTGLPPARLVLEVTETAILGGEAIAERVVQELLGLGIGLALDDFGTGYSSLSYLQRFPFCEVKIDRSFVAGIETTPVNIAIIRGVIRIARDIGIDVVAEGIETEAQAQVLRNEGCGYLQGFLFAKPRRFTDIVSDLAVQRLRETRHGRQEDHYLKELASRNALRAR